VITTQTRAGRTIDWNHVDRWAEQWGIADRLARLRDELGLGSA
jgi:hypothetical protein